jgi:RHS repeat-associated protein
MTYAGNQMTRVDEAAAAISIAESMDFKNGSNVANEYTYNANGAMNKDLNKGITEIQYNSLNLPRQMIINSSSVKAKNYYTYSASGVKLRTEQRYDPNYTVTPSNATNPTNDGLADYKNTDYAGNIIYETVKSGSTITNKTRILVDGGYIEGGLYYYYLTDHLGNNRVVANASGTVIQRNHYYPFGMSFADTPLAEQGKQPYKYNGKELDQMHQLNLYDNLARLYDPVIPRTTTPDPHAENYYSWSPYSWVANNPMKYIDPNGMDWWTTSDAAEIERVLAALKSGETVNSQEFGDQWTRVEEVSENDYAIFDDQTSDFTIDGVSYKDFKGYGKRNNHGLYSIGSRISTSLGLGGTLSGFSSASFRLTNGAYNGSILSPKLYSSGWAGGSVARISTYKLAQAGKVLSGATFVASSVIDGIGLYNYYQNPTASNVVTPEKAGLNLMYGYAAYVNPYFGVPYALTELFVPGGMNAVIAAGMEVHQFHNEMSRKYWYYPNYSTITQH